MSETRAPEAAPWRQHVLLTVLGTNPTAARYAVGAREVEARLAPAALLHLLSEKDRPRRVLALCTEEAKRDSLPLLECELGKLGSMQGHRIPINVVPIPARGEQEDVDRFLGTVVGAVSKIGEDIDLSVDVTHGFRHFSFLTYIAVLYLAALGRVRVRGAYYGLLSRDAPSPFLDLRPLLDLPRWVHALEVLRDTGSALPMAQILGESPVSQPAKDNARDLERLSEAHLSALPLELGWQARNILDQGLKPLRKLLKWGHRLPRADEVIEQFQRIIDPVAFPEVNSGDGWKRKVELSCGELERQARIIDNLLKRGSHATALRLMREWAVSWVVSRQATAIGCVSSDWLDRRVRRPAEGLLHAIRAVGNDPDLRGKLTEEQRNLGKFWSDLTEVRNAYAHHGMGHEDLVRSKKSKATRRRVLDFWCEALRSQPDISLALGDSAGRRVLVSPIGMRPGVLFSALNVLKQSEDEEIGNEKPAALCLVICSRESEGMIVEAVRQAGFEGECKPLVLKDAFGGGSAEIEELAGMAKTHLVGAAEVLVNVTGGTTLMGLAAERLTDKARRLACPVVRRFGLIDRRPPSQQETDPYQAGEPFWLHDGEDHDGR